MIKMTMNQNVSKNGKFRVNLFDLQHDRFYIKISDNLRDKLLINIKNEYISIPKFCKKFNLSFVVFYSWIKKREFPLIIIHKLINLFNINKGLVQKNLEGLKSGYFRDNKKGTHSKMIFPQFPIKLSEGLARIIARFFDDGVISITKKGFIVAIYYNQSKILRENFKRDIKKIFGVNSFTEGINKTTPYVLVLTPIALILLYLVPTFSSKNCTVPDFIMNSSKSIKREFLKAFFDDEAHVRYAPPHRYIEITLSNKDFLKDIKQLLSDFNIKSTKIY